MKTTPTKRATANGPKARVAFIDCVHGQPHPVSTEKYCGSVLRGVYDPVAVIPFRTAKQAKAFVRVANMSREEQIELIGSALAFGIYEKAGMWEKLMEATRISWRRTAVHMLKALNLPTP